MAYYLKVQALPRNHLRLKPQRISLADLYEAGAFGWRTFATVPVMGAARAMSDIATLLMQDVLPQDARNPKELAAWIQEDAEDFSQTIMNRLQLLDWRKVRDSALFGLLRGAMDQLVLVLLRASITQLLGAPNAEEGLASLMHRPLIELRQKIIGGWFLFTSPAASLGDLRVMSGDEFNMTPEPFAFSWLFRLVRSDGFAYAEHTFAKYALLNIAPYLVQFFVEFYHLLRGRQSISQLLVRLGDQFSRRSGASIGAAITMGICAPSLPYTGTFRNMALLAIEYAGQYLGSLYAQGFSRKYLFGTPEPLLDDAEIAKQKMLAKNGRVASRSSLAGSQNGEDDGDDLEDVDESNSFAVRKPAGRSARRPPQEAAGPRRSQNGRQTPPSRSRTPVSNGDYAPPSRSPPPMFDASDAPPRAVSPVIPVSSDQSQQPADGAPMSRAAMRLSRLRQQQQQPQSAARPQPQPTAPIAATAEDPIIPRSVSPAPVVAPQPVREAPASSPFEEPLPDSEDDDDDE